MATHNTPPTSEDPFSDWEPARNWLEPDLNEPEDHSDDICPCGDPDCSQPFDHAE